MVHSASSLDHHTAISLFVGRCPQLGPASPDDDLATRPTYLRNYRYISSLTCRYARGEDVTARPTRESWNTRGPRRAASLGAGDNGKCDRMVGFVGVLLVQSAALLHAALAAKDVDQAAELAAAHVERGCSEDYAEGIELRECLCVEGQQQLTESRDVSRVSNYSE
jgi:hypothetical protein